MRRENNLKKNSCGDYSSGISNSRAMGVIVLIALLFVFQAATFIMQKVRKAKLPVGEEPVTVEKETVKFSFNPNTIPLDSLQMLGFTPKQAQSVLNYRSKGGKFRIRKDFAKLYVVDSAMYRALEQYILLPDSVIAPVLEKKKSVAKKNLSGRKKRVNADSAWKMETRDTFYGKRVEENRYICNLNTADSAALVRLYGIGGYYAGKILDYRDRLGGSFADKRQLLEIKGFTQERYEKIEHSVIVQKEEVRHFSILEADKRVLERHPYIGRYAARGILLYLEIKGRDTFASDLQLLDGLLKEHIITEDNAARLKEYLR